MQTTDLVKRLRIVSGMINMGEKIPWGQDTALMSEAADCIEMLHALQSAPALNWQPIATAPEEGAFLAYCRWYMVSAKDSHAPYWTNWMPRHSWMCLGQVQGEGSTLSYVDRVEATHWMPLPKPPQPKG